VYCPTARRLVRIHIVHGRLLHQCLACGGDVHIVPKFIEYILLSCPCWECHRRNFGTLVQDFMAFVRKLASSLEDLAKLLLGGVPPSFHFAIHFIRNERIFKFWRQALPHIALKFMYRITPETFRSVRWALLLLALLE
jgi:hypothetical protein